MKTYYIDSNSLLHRLNPLTKVIATLPFIVFLTCVTDMWVPLAFIILFAATTTILGKIPVLRYIKIVTPLLLLVTGFPIVYPLVVDPSRVSNTAIAYQLGSITVYWGGIMFGFATALRIFSFISAGLLFTLTSQSSDFIRAMIQQWHLPYRIGFSAIASFRFVPMLNSEFTTIQSAHKIRGVSDKKGFRAAFDRAKRYAVPLLATAIRKAERTALAMDSRAFGAYEDRTYYRRFKFSPADWVFLSAFWLIGLGILFLLRKFDLIGSLIFMQQY